MQYFDVSKLKSVKNKIRSVFFKLVTIREFFKLIKIPQVRTLELWLREYATFACDVDIF